MKVKVFVNVGNSDTVLVNGDIAERPISFIIKNFGNPKVDCSDAFSEIKKELHRIFDFYSDKWSVLPYPIEAFIELMMDGLSSFLKVLAGMEPKVEDYGVFGNKLLYSLDEINIGIKFGTFADESED